MDWWNVLKGRGKIRIPAKRKRKLPTTHPSKALRGGRYVRTMRDAKREHRRQLENTRAENKHLDDRFRLFNQPQVMDHVMQDSKASSTNTLPIDMGPPSKFRRRGNVKRQDDFSPKRPPRRKPVAFDRPGFRTGGGETLPLPDSERERDKNELMGEWGEDDGLHYEIQRLGGFIPSRADKVNRPQENPFYHPNEEQIRALNERIRFLQNQQYDRAGNRIQQGEQNE